MTTLRAAGRNRRDRQRFEANSVHMATLDVTGLITSFQESFDTYAAAEAFRP
jgi:hypothetical protein